MYSARSPCPSCSRLECTNRSEGGTGYILMDKVQGVPVHARWEVRESDIAIDQVLNMKQRFAWYRFSQFGGLFYKEDVAPALRDQPRYEVGKERDNKGADRFRVGSLKDWAIWRVQVDRGLGQMLFHTSELSFRLNSNGFETMQLFDQLRRKLLPMATRNIVSSFSTIFTLSLLTYLIPPPKISQSII
ncbi:hypothetical protein C8J56DRAFT_459727 [Mycena floridula]|nr:hypothetical protein C8J56DRAFT_459727 [Mycena floridula]